MTSTWVEELVALGDALVRALQAGDLDAAERLAEDRQRALDRCQRQTLAVRADDPPATQEAARTIVSGDLRGRDILGAILDATRAELAGLAAGASAVRAYGPLEPLAPGFVDRRD